MSYSDKFSNHVCSYSHLHYTDCSVISTARSKQKYGVAFFSLGTCTAVSWFWFMCMRWTMVEWSTAFERWRWEHYVYFYCTKENEHNGKVQTVSRTDWHNTGSLLTLSWTSDVVSDLGVLCYLLSVAFLMIIFWDSLVTASSVTLFLFVIRVLCFKCLYFCCH